MEALRDAHPHQAVLLQVVLGHSASVPPAQGINIKLTGSSCKEKQRLSSERMVCVKQVLWGYSLQFIHMTFFDYCFPFY